MHAKKIIEGQQHGLHVMQFSTVRVEAPLLCKANSTFIHSNSRSFYVFPFFFFFFVISTVLYITRHNFNIKQNVFT